MRCHCWIRQILSDAREPMNLENWFGGLVPHGDWVACDDYRNKIGKSLAKNEPEDVQ